MITGRYYERENRTYINARCCCCNREDTWDFEGKVEISQHMELMCEWCLDNEARQDELLAKWNFTEERKAKAAKAREWRATFAAARGLSAHMRSLTNDWIRTTVIGNHRALPKFTEAALNRAADQLSAFAESDWQSHDTEYYSACGWDDYQSEARYEARREAHELRHVARILRFA